MKAWRVLDEYVYVYHAESRGAARLAHCEEHGLEYYEALELSVRRWPAMDDLEPTAFNMVATGTVQWVEEGCPGCGATIHTYEVSGQMRFYVESGDTELAHHDEATGDLWCSRACYEGRSPAWAVPGFSNGHRRLGTFRFTNS